MKSRKSGGNFFTFASNEFRFDYFCFGAPQSDQSIFFKKLIN